MKHILTMLLCLLTIAAGAQSFEKGVTKTLADYRTRTISNVSYDLTFNIPATQKERVHGTAIISFFLAEKAVVVLDFQGRFSGACLVNGKKRVAGMKNEHIIIPQKMTKKGLNSIEMNFVCHDKALNRQGDYVYTLFAPGQAQQCFPCFDQPDLRAQFTTQMNVPKDWKTIASDSSTPIPTSLYAFVAGRFEELQQRTREGYQMSVLHREQAPEKVKQLPKIIEEASQSLRWMESYTGVRYPFEAFSMVILPDYQPGGMELPGAMLLTDKHLFLSEKPSHNEQLRRRELIAHETAHQWFGSIVTQKQAGEAWTTEVLANFMAYDCQLSGEVPDFWDKFDNIGIIQLYNNPGLTGSLPASCGRASTTAKTYSLRFDGCNFTGNIPESYATLPSQCKQFYVKNNKLSGVVPAGVQAHANWGNWKAADNILPQQEGYGLTLE